MINIKTAKDTDIEVLALLGRLTYAESHGQFIDDKNDLLKHLDTNFSVAKTRLDMSNPEHIFYLIYVDDLPVGYAKLIVNVPHERINSENNACLEKIYILNDFIPLRIGQKLLTFVQEEAKALQLDTMWLTVYVKNVRAIRFYEKNEYKNLGNIEFMVNGKAYDNLVFSKEL